MTPRTAINRLRNLAANIDTTNSKTAEASLFKLIGAIKFAADAIDDDKDHEQLDTLRATVNSLATRLEIATTKIATDDTRAEFQSFHALRDVCRTFVASFHHATTERP